MQPLHNCSMKTQPIGKSDLISTRLGWGNMRSVGTWIPAEVTDEKRAAAVAAHHAAYEAGYTLFDTADIYCRGVCEEMLGIALRENREMRSRILIATKCGIRFPGEPTKSAPHRYDFSAEHIRSSCDGSLQRLGIETIDLYQLHRTDMLMNPQEIAAAFDKLKAAGKVRYFGVSNMTPSQLLALQAHCPMPLIVNQVEIHLGRLDCFFDGTLDQCLEKWITPLAWSPLGNGWLATGKSPKETDEKREERQKMLDDLDKIADELGLSRTVLAIAWLMKHPSGIIPIIGTSNPEHIREAVAADDVELSREDWYRVLRIGRGKRLP